MSIGARLKETRESLRKTQAEFASSLNVGLSTYSAYENGHQLPKSDVIVRICQEYDVSADWLLGLDPTLKIKTEADLLQLALLLRKIGASVSDAWLSFGDPSNPGPVGYVYRGIIAAYESDNLNSTFDTIRILENKVNEAVEADKELLQQSVDSYIEGQIEFLKDKYVLNQTDAKIAFKIAQVYREHLLSEKFNERLASET